MLRTMCKLVKKQYIKQYFKHYIKQYIKHLKSKLNPQQKMS